MKKKAITPNLTDTAAPNVTTTTAVVQKKRRPLWVTALFVLGGMWLAAAALRSLAPPKPAINTGQTLSSASWSTLVEATNTPVAEAPPIEPTPVPIELTPIPVEPTPLLVEPPVFLVPTEEVALPPQ